MCDWPLLVSTSNVAVFIDKSAEISILTLKLRRQSVSLKFTCCTKDSTCSLIVVQKTCVDRYNRGQQTDIENFLNYFVKRVCVQQFVLAFVSKLVIHSKTKNEILLYNVTSSRFITLHIYCNSVLTYTLLNNLNYHQLYRV